MKNFDCKRYWLVLKQNVIQGRKRFLSSYAGVFLGLFLTFMCISIGTRSNPCYDYTLQPVARLYAKRRGPNLLRVHAGLPGFR